MYVYLLKMRPIPENYCRQFSQCSRKVEAQNARYLKTMNQSMNQDARYNITHEKDNESIAAKAAALIFLKIFRKSLF